MTFWLLAALLVSIALVFVLPPLFHTHERTGKMSRLDINRAIYQQKVADLAADLERGLLDQEEYENALADVQHTLLEDAGNAPPMPAGPVSNTLIIFAIAGALPMAALFIYQQVSTYQSQQQLAQMRTEAAQSQSMQAMIAGLEKKLRADPGNVQGWQMLGRSYFALQQYEQAKNAYVKAADLVNQSDPDILILLAEASAFSNGDAFSEYEHVLLNKALAINPNHERGLWYAGYAAYTENNYAQASKHWAALLRLAPDDKDDVKENLLELLEDARRRAGLAADAQQATSLAADSGSDERSIRVSVRLNAGISRRVRPEDTLFIYARAAAGPGMPLSLAKLTVADLPVTINLNKHMAMLPAMTLDSFQQVEVLARISKSGQAMPQPGDLISAPVGVNFSESPFASVELDINSIVE